MYKVFSLILLFFILGQTPFTHAKNDAINITTWNYYLSEPFANKKGKGLALDFTNLLNKIMPEKYHFKLKNIPRARLNLLLENQDNQGIVLFVNSSWMGKNAKDKYLWTPAIYQDYNDIISAKKKITYNTPQSLIGLRFGGISGRKYRYLEELFDKRLVQRIDLRTEEQAMMMLIQGRIDVTSQPRSITNYLIQKLKLQEKVFISPKPLFKFDRRIMLTHKLNKLHLDLSDGILQLSKDDKWINLKKKYGLPFISHQSN